MDLRSRLSRIRKLKAPSREPPPPEEPVPSPPEGPSVFEERGWKPAAYQTLKREQLVELPIPLPRTLPSALNILVPGIEGVPPESLEFFDLETTGLSGAGTIAFLAAFGSLWSFSAPGGRTGAKLSITQYLLLDYPGEAGFLEALRSELEAGPILVSYNGKTFDVPILRNRFFMKGMDPPAFGHVDLLYSARRLWRRFLPDCSLGTVEREVLSIRREDDLPGTFAPDAWFGFLRDGNAAALLQICDHNLRDILGLASLLGCLCRIAQDPLENRFHPDPEQLWLCWWGALRRGLCTDREYPRVRSLLERGAEKGYPRCCRKLAVEAEWRRGDILEALKLVERALAFTPEGGDEGRPGFLPGKLREDLEKRRRRLLSKAGL
jgi:uncharacterized protein YprB with RNaseH-like and TPR domain